MLVTRKSNFNRIAGLRRVTLIGTVLNTLTANYEINRTLRALPDCQNTSYLVLTHKKNLFSGNCPGSQYAKRNDNSNGVLDLIFMKVRGNVYSIPKVSRIY